MSTNKSLLRLASSMPVGSASRKAILLNLRAASSDFFEGRVRVENENGRLVWVLKETLNGPEGKRFKRVKDKGDDAAKGSKKKYTPKRTYKEHSDGSYTDEDYGVRIEKGIPKETWEAFLDDPEGKDLLENFKINIIAGRDGLLTTEHLKNAVDLRRKLNKYSAELDKKEKAKERGEKYDPKIDDICDTDAFPANEGKGVCAGNMGITRDSMPQLGQRPVKDMLKAVDDKRYAELKTLMKENPREFDKLDGRDKDALFDRMNAEAAVRAGADPESTTSIFDDWVEHLKKDRGVTMTDLSKLKDKDGKPMPGTMSVKDLKATQSEINADTAVKNSAKYLSGKMDLNNPKPNEIIYVSSDGHILDGHHRWSGLLLADPDTKIPVIRINKPMKDILEDALNFKGVFRQDVKFRPVADDAPINLRRSPGSVWKQRNGKFYGQKSKDEVGGPYDTEEAAKAYATGKSESKKTARMLTASDKVALLRMASLMPKGSDERRAILAGLAKSADQWVSKAIKHPGRLHEYFGIPKGENIPVAKIDAEIKKLDSKKDKTDADLSLLRALNLAKTLRKF